MSGYGSAEYAWALSEFGAPLQLPTARGWLLTRDVPEGSARDASGCYPLFCCGNWDGLSADLSRLPADLVTVSLVTDPMTAPPLATLRDCFPDVYYRYKDHYIADLSQPLASFVAPHHQRNARRATKAVRVERQTKPIEHLESWNSLYSGLVERHAIRGIAAFSADSFAKQMQTPGLMAYNATAGDDVVGMVLWMVSDNVAYYHLAAYSDAGYELKTSFALFWQCFEAFAAEGITHVALGGGAGVFAADQGLSRFKQGWSNETRPAYFCGRILDRERYGELVNRAGHVSTAYFPAYRAPGPRERGLIFRKQLLPMTMTADYHQIVAHYESCLARHGDNHRGVDWPNANDAKLRYEVMLEVIRAGEERPVKLLDFGCGAGHLLEFLQGSRRDHIEYLGLDLSPTFVELCQRKFPGVEFICADVLENSAGIPDVDYVVMNGVFTEKRSLPFDAMFEHFQQVLKRVFPLARRGLAFNVMSKHVDWERDDLFHLSFDALAAFLKREISRNFLVRADYGLYEYTTYVYR